MKKLVRDLIPSIINDSGRRAVYYHAKGDELKCLLQQKLIEEVHEFLESESPEELVDVLEVIDALCDFYQFDKESIKKIKETKCLEKGAFKEKIVLVEIQKM